MKKLVSISLAIALFVGIAAVVWANAGSVTVASRTGIDVYGPLDHYAALGDADWGSANPAVATWVHPSWPSIPGAVWISSSYQVEAPYSANSWRWFHDEMTLPCTAYNIAASVVMATADNAEEFYFNEVFVGSDGEVQGPFVDNYEWGTIVSYPISPTPGVNKLDFIVRNYAGTNSQTGNPTGLIYKTTVDYEVPDVVWQPPITNDAFELKDGTTLPLKFKLYKQDGTLITDMQDVSMKVEGPAGEVATWSLGDGVDNLRFDPYEFYYIANFQTKNFNLTDGATYTAVVYDGCTNEALGEISFMLSTANGTGRGNK
jgi:hypothetical protein